MKQKKKPNSPAKKRSAAKAPAAEATPFSFAAIATKRFTEETRQMLGQHIRNKHGIRRGR